MLAFDMPFRFSASITAVAVLTALGSLPAQAHLSYTGRNLGSFSGLVDATQTLSNQTVTGNFGWADATDADWGDSHKARAFRFHLDHAAIVTLTARANAAATGTSLGGLLPGLSVYRGLAHIAPDAADHDTAPISQAYLASLPGPAKEGAWHALGDWRLGNDDGLTFDDLSPFSFEGYAVDGTAANFGNAPGVIGDGQADGLVTGTFTLAAGDYSVFVGGADYAAQATSNPDLNKAYGLSLSLNVAAVPEAQTAVLALLGLGLVGWARRARCMRLSAQ